MVKYTLIMSNIELVDNPSKGNKDRLELEYLHTIKEEKQ